MVSMLACGRVDSELDEIYVISKDLAAIMTEDRWNIEILNSADKVKSYLAKDSILDAVCFDISMEDGIALLEKVREKNRSAYILLIAGTDISPSIYIKPTIMPSSLMLRPLSSEIIKQEIKLMINFFDSTETDMFVLKDKDGKNRIPFNKILYFEAREKKIYACTASREYAFYDSMEKLTEKIPEYFYRCHRGFIVNSKEIIKVSISNNTIFLKDDYRIPLSRSYKGFFKEFLK